MVGSRAYGTDRPDSDVDLRGFYVAPACDLLAGRPVKEQHEADEPDLVVYEVAKLAKLAAAGNPNALEVVFSDQVVHADAAGRTLLDGRDRLLSAAAYNAYRGFAVNQVRKFEAGTGGSATKRHKFLLHAFRLLETGARLLATGELVVRHPDPERLAADARADDTEAVGHFARLLDELDAAAERTVLPARPTPGDVADLVLAVRAAAEPAVRHLTTANA